MICCGRKQTKKIKNRRGSVYPIKSFEKKINNRGPDAKYVEKFSKEVIYCGGCEQPFDLGSNELKIHCNICNRFFHCKIAGNCRGNDCKIIKPCGGEHRASYCLMCVSYVFSDKTCLCKDCKSLKSIHLHR
tara:strand:+ start:88 stop:480 length:393 start_codon:yes stop_codon:yes gene_type:complete